MRCAVVGIGAVGARVARQLVSSDDVEDVVLRDVDAQRADDVAERLVERCHVDRGAGSDLTGADVVVLTVPGAEQVALAGAHLAHGAHVVSVADDLDVVRGLIALDAVAAERQRSLVVGAGFSPGLSCLLAMHAAADLDEVLEVHVASSGTAGPACARQRHRSLARAGLEWRDGGWTRTTPGTGRELCWFPDPLGGLECRRAAGSEPLLLVPGLPGVRRVSSRRAASVRDLAVARFPWVGPERPDGGPGGLRVEVRGRRDGGAVELVYGVLDRPSVAAAAVAALAARHAGSGTLERVGAGGLAEMMADRDALAALAERGVRAAVFEGAGGS